MQPSGDNKSQPNSNFWAAGFSDLSTFTLLASNLVTIFLALNQHWSLKDVFWAYWFQSIAIGLFNAIRIFNLQKFTTKGLTSNGHPVPPTRESKIKTGIFFIFHYGFFHFGYAAFLVSSFGWFSQKILFGAGILLLHHLFSYFYHRAQDNQIEQNLGSIMFRPYPRIIPMHLIIFISSAIPFAPAVMTIFLLMKTAADLVMHVSEHRPRPN
jgi:hypothetical protein